MNDKVNRTEAKVVPLQNAELVSVSKLKIMLNEPDMSDEQAKEILYNVRTLVNIIVEVQYELELNQQSKNEFKIAAWTQAHNPY